MTQQTDWLRRLLIEFDNADKSTDENALRAFKTTEQAIESKLLEAIGEDETVGENTEILNALLAQGHFCTPVVRMYHLNQLRAEILQKLGINHGAK